MTKPSNLLQGTARSADSEDPRTRAAETGGPSRQRLPQVSGDVLQVSDGSLYPALHKLEQQGWITAEWQSTENNRRAKIYALTPPRASLPAAGERELGAAVPGHHPGGAAASLSHAD